MIRINVGGTVFCTTERTLLGDGGLANYFHGLLGGAIGTTRDESGAFFIDRNPRTFALLLELLRTGLLPFDLADEVLLRALLVEADYYLLTPRVSVALCAFDAGLYSLSSSEVGRAASQGWLLFVERRIDASALHPCEVLLTGVVDDSLLLRQPASLRCGGFLVASVHGKELVMRRTSEHASQGARVLGQPKMGVECTVGDRSCVLLKESDPGAVYDEETIPLRMKMLHGKGKMNTTVRWFDRDAETSELLLWKQKASDGRSICYNTLQLCPQLLLFGRGEWDGLVFVSGKIPFIMKRAKKEGPLVVLALQRQGVHARDLALDNAQ